MSIPPIPPNCEILFKKSDDEISYFKTPDFESSIKYGVEFGWRPIIAAVAEVAWRKEMRRIDIEFNARATDNAAAWREWGEG